MRKMIVLAVVLFAIGAMAQTSRSVSLVWNDTQNPTGTTYNVYRTAAQSTMTPCMGTPVFTKITATPVSTLAYTDAAVTTGNSYCYYVTAVSNGLESAPSNTATAVVGPFAPTNLTGTPH